MGTYTPFTVIGEAIAGESKQARDRLESLIKGAHKNTFEIGRQLHIIKKYAYYDGYTTFTEYLGTLDYKLRKLQYMRRIAEVTDILGIPSEIYEPVGVSKLREICSLDISKTWVNPDTGEEISLGVFVAEFMSKALLMSVDEVKSFIRTLKGITPEQELVHRHFYVSAQVLQEIVEPAIETAKRLLGTMKRDDEGNAVDYSDGRALEVVCADFLSDPANSFIANQDRKEQLEGTI